MEVKGGLPSAHGRQHSSISSPAHWSRLEHNSSDNFSTQSALPPLHQTSRDSTHSSLYWLIVRSPASQHFGSSASFYLLSLIEIPVMFIHREIDSEPACLAPFFHSLLASLCWQKHASKGQTETFFGFNSTITSGYSGPPPPLAILHIQFGLLVSLFL
jgi:hypothetical protein